MTKKILGLDLGTNSIGWALIEKDEKETNGKILAAGSRIIPMSQDILGKFDSGVSISQTAERTTFRGIRRLRERHLLRRDRLHRVLNIIGFLPSHYAAQIDFDKRLGQFIPETEPKLPYIFNKETNKPDFLFKKSFDEMVKDFILHQPQLLENGKKIPYDWTIYYLRKKALTEKIEKEELAWLLLNFNQKRGYYQLRGEDDDEMPNKLVEFYSLKVIDVVATDDKKGDEIWYNVHLENGWIYRRTSKTFLDWVGKTKEFIVTTDLNDDGTVKKDKEGKEKRSFRAPAENDWTLVKKKTEFDIDKSHKTVGAYIYDTLLQKPDQKIKGRLVRVIERKFYKAELEIILKTQQTFNPELKDIALYRLCLEELYENNEAHRSSIGTKDFTHLFLNDIIFFQRPLKSKKSLISNCKFENRIFFKDGILQNKPLKCIAISHPLFQEYRLWQWLQNLRIFEKDTERNVTEEFLKTEDDWVNLFTWLNDRKDIDHKALLSHLTKPLKLKASSYRWNYVYDEQKDESKSYPCNETRAQIRTRLAKCENIPTDFLTKEKEETLWHILYSVEDKIDIEKALKTFANKNTLGDDFVENFKKFPPFKKDYGAYSAKALKKILPLMRMGKYWDENGFHPQTKERIEKLLTGEYDESIRNRVREKAINLNTLSDFRALPQWLASYIVYDRHSEDSLSTKWKTANEIETLEQHSLRNPIVEQVINETLQVVKAIWTQHGNGKENFFDEIHIELGREMKNPADKRKEMTNRLSENENTNLRMKALLMELMNDGNTENIRPYSPTQLEILKIYEEGVLSAADGNIPDDILKISKQAQPSQSELLKYTLWLQQKYRSPYTGEIIPLSKLFTREYDIEHIIPQSRYFDDSLSNKVICETAVNKDKDNQLGFEYIKGNYGKTIELTGGKHVKILTVEAYEKFVKENYSKSRSKMKKLLMDEIPETFVQRQLNDSRYISKVVKNLMSNIVREHDEQEAISKNVIACTGAITSTLKQDWGLNDVWNELITPRFERLNQITNSSNFGEWTNKEGKQVFQTQVPLEFQKGFSKKRIDHRHHALDAIVIACASRSHINYLNNESALGKSSNEEKAKKRYDLKQKLCFKKFTDDSKQNYKWLLTKPWDTFTQDTKEVLHNIVVSFKQNLRVINKTINHYQVWKKDEYGKLKKESIKQIKGDNWAVRKPMHTPMPYGKKIYVFDILRIAENVGKRSLIIDEFLKDKVEEIFIQFDGKITATQSHLKKNPIRDKEGNIVLVTAFSLHTEKFRKRQPITKLSNRGQGGIKTTEDAIKLINKVADFEIRNSLLFHLKNNESNIDIAFNSDGIDKFNSKRKIPVYKLPIAETGEMRFSVGHTIGTKHKWMESAEGTNLFFTVYVDKERGRKYHSLPFNEVIENQKQGAMNKIKPQNCSAPLKFIDEKTQIEYNLLFQLSPNDLVYIPTEEEREQKNKINFEKLNKAQSIRIYKLVSCTGNEAHFVPHYYSKEIVKNEMGTNNKSQNTIDGIQIKQFCIKLKVDRLGKIKSVAQ